MISRLKTLNEKHAQKVRNEKEKRTSENVEWVVSKFQENPVHVSDLEDIALAGGTQINVFSRVGEHEGFYCLGRHYYNYAPNIHNCDEWKKEARQSCNAVKNMFEIMNKKEEWNLKIESNCDNGAVADLYVKASW